MKFLILTILFAAISQGVMFADDNQKKLESLVSLQQSQIKLLEQKITKLESRLDAKDGELEKSIEQ
jgi:hypothetical protein